MKYPSSRGYSSRSRQQGAVLYVALIMLVLLALIGIVGMQVAGLQERMAANYRTVNLAFQNTEALARSTECGLERLNEVPDVAAGNCTIVDRSEIATRCDDGYDAGVWADARVLANAPARNIRQIEGCIIGETEIGMGGSQEQGGGLQPIYQITTYQTDTSGGANPTSAAAVDTIFKL
jgi:type IV pilus assembly protein PilX